ncbi:MAG TPA: OPT/YSL family transporter [Phycisphaerales bacterium]|nr:OPT/YSL family transporter [Phycisphaerales bacterium]
MAIPTLTDEQVRTWTPQQKDRWWLDNVFRGNMAQLTLRSALTGFVLGGLLSATNLYVGAKTGWTLGVGLTSVILAFAMFKVLTRFGARDMTILENNAMQSIATAAGYMTGPLISGMAAYMWIENRPMPWWQMFWFNVVLSVLGVLVAFPMKRRFINNEQQPFPEGRACGVVLDTLYTSTANVGIFKAKALAIAASIAGGLTFLSGEAYLKALNAVRLKFTSGETWANTLVKFKEKLDATWHLPHNCDPLFAWLAKTNSEPRLAGVTWKQLGINPALDLAMIGAGGLMGIRAATSMFIGMVLNFFIIVPWMISKGEIVPKAGSVAAGDAVFGRAYILNTWALWYGIVLMVVASMVALFAKPEVFVEAFRGLFQRGKSAGEDVVKHIEFPTWISWVGIPIVGAVGVWMAHSWFGVSWVFGATAIPLIIVLTLIAASSTGMTGITPTGSLSKIPQFMYGALDPKHPPTNLMTGVMCVEVASNASNLLMDIKPGYMLGAKPRQQAIGHIIGIIAGSLASTPLFFALFMSGYSPEQAAVNPLHVQEVMAPEGGQFGFPSAVQWKGVSELVTSIFGEAGKGTLLTGSIITSMVIAGVVSLVFECLRIFTKNKFPISPLAIGLGVVVPPESTLCMFLGAVFFWLMHKMYHARENSMGNKLWVQTHEPICAGIIAGAALIGIGDTLVKVFALK